jgi:hypothetical protein
VTMTFLSILSRTLAATHQQAAVRGAAVPRAQISLFVTHLSPTANRGDTSPMPGRLQCSTLEADFPLNRFSTRDSAWAVSGSVDGDCGFGARAAQMCVAANSTMVPTETSLVLDTTRCVSKLLRPFPQVLQCGCCCSVASRECAGLRRCSCSATATPLALSCPILLSCST